MTKCQCVTAKGKLCSRNVKAGQKYCHQHKNCVNGKKDYCICITKKGKRCSKKQSAATNFCYLHQNCRQTYDTENKKEDKKYAKPESKKGASDVKAARPESKKGASDVKVARPESKKVVQLEKPESKKGASDVKAARPESKKVVRVQVEKPECKRGASAPPESQGLIKVVLPIKNLERQECEAIVRKYERGKTLGQGAFGAVYEACVNINDCKYAVKAAKSDDSDEINANQRDPYFLEVLQEKKLDGSNIVPRIYDSWSCRSQDDVTIYTVMDRWQGNMESLALHRPGRAYYRSELLRMFRIAVFLGQLGIIHGDLKPDQFLYRNSGGDSEALEIVVADFGFSGGGKYQYTARVGWPANGGIGCPEAWTELDWCKDGKYPCPADDPAMYPTSSKISYPSYINVLHLEAVLIFDKISTVLHSSDVELGKFVGIGGFKADDQSNHCLKWSDKKRAKLRKGIPKENRHYIELCELL
jgi:hypothetical protein